VTPNPTKPLLNATDDELISLLGVYALPLIQGPGELLLSGRGGNFWTSGPDVQGSGKIFVHEAFESAAKVFLRRWIKQLRQAICHGDLAFLSLHSKGLSRDLFIAGVAGSLAAAIPELASFSGLLTVLAVFVVRSGGKAFCEMLDELEATKTPRSRRSGRRKRSSLTARNR